MQEEEREAADLLRAHATDTGWWRDALPAATRAVDRGDERRALALVGDALRVAHQKTRRALLRVRGWPAVTIRWEPEGPGDPGELTYVVVADGLADETLILAIDGQTTREIARLPACFEGPPDEWTEAQRSDLADALRDHILEEGTLGTAELDFQAEPIFEWLAEAAEAAQSEAKTA